MKIQSFNTLAPFYDLFARIFRRQIPEQILSRLNPGDRDVILDLGGGTGYNSRRMMSPDRLVIIFDISLKMLQKAGKYRQPDLVLGDARMLPFKDKCFDAILAVDSLHHVRDYPGVLREVRRTGKNKFFVAEFYGRSPLGKMFTKLERLFFPVLYKRPDEFRREAFYYKIEGDYEYISSFEYFFLGGIQ